MDKTPQKYPKLWPILEVLTRTDEKLDHATKRALYDSLEEFSEEELKDTIRNVGKSYIRETYIRGVGMDPVEAGKAADGAVANRVSKLIVELKGFREISKNAQGTFQPLDEQKMSRYLHLAGGKGKS